MKQKILIEQAEFYPPAPQLTKRSAPNGSNELRKKPLAAVRCFLNFYYTTGAESFSGIWNFY